MNIGVLEFVLGIVLIGTIGSILKARYGVRKDMWGNETHPDEDAAATTENARLQDEVRALRERVQVLERVVTDDEGSSKQLEREIERLRDKNRV